MWKIRMMRLNDLTAFIKIVEKGSLAAAGRKPGLSPTTVSERLAALQLVEIASYSASLCFARHPPARILGDVRPPFFG